MNTPIIETKIEAPEIHWKAGFDVMGLVHHWKEPSEIAALWERFQERIEAMEHKFPFADSYGVSNHFGAKTAAWDYLAGMEVVGSVTVPDDMERWQIPAGTYAVFSCTLVEIGRIYDHIYSEWLPNSGFKRRLGPAYEHYDDQFDSRDPAAKLHVYIPVTK